MIDLKDWLYSVVRYIGVEDKNRNIYSSLAKCFSYCILLYSPSDNVGNEGNMRKIASHVVGDVPRHKTHR